MKKRYFSSFIILTFVVAVSYSQSVSFLNTPSDARTAAMGNAGYMISSPFSVQYNSISVMADNDVATGVGASLLFWQPQAIDATLVNVAGYHRFNKLGIMAGYRSNKMSDIEKTDVNGNILGTYAPSEYALDLGVGYNVSDNISLGVALHHISSRLDQESSSSALASDISILYHRERLRVGIGVANLGSKIDYGYADYSLPTRVKSGITYRLLSGGDHSLYSAADLYYQLVDNYEGIAGGLGMEYGYRDMLFLRTGYHYESENVGASYATVGLGAKFSKISLDLAYLAAQEDNPILQTFLISLKWER